MISANLPVLIVVLPMLAALLCYLRAARLDIYAAGRSDDVDDLTPETFLIRDFSSEAVDGEAG